MALKDITVDNRDNPDEYYPPSPWISQNTTIKNRHGDLIAECSSATVQNTIANARLMAAAPEMLSALKDVVSDIEALDEDSRIAWLESGTLAYVLHVIKKATTEEINNAPHV